MCSWSGVTQGGRWEGGFYLRLSKRFALPKLHSDDKLANHGFWTPEEGPRSVSVTPTAKHYDNCPQLQVTQSQKLLAQV